MDFNTDLGPLVSRSQVETVERYVALGRDEVGEPICGGARPEGLADGLDPAAFYTPTIFAGVPNSAKIAQEEIFGPVLSVIPYETDDEAIAIANDSIYGLAGGVQSTNLDRARSVANRMRTGTVWINDYHLISPERPFGGYKQSGIGRELGLNGLRAYQQVKHIHANPGGTRANIGSRPPSPPRWGDGAAVRSATGIGGHALGDRLGEGLGLLLGHVGLAGVEVVELVLGEVGVDQGVGGALGLRRRHAALLQLFGEVSLVELARAVGAAGGSGEGQQEDGGDEGELAGVHGELLEQVGGVPRHARMIHPGAPAARSGPDGRPWRTSRRTSVRRRLRPCW
jgi:hypothetical protein